MPVNIISQSGKTVSIDMAFSGQLINLSVSSGLLISTALYRVSQYIISGFDPALVIDFESDYFRKHSRNTTLASLATHTRASSATYTDASGILQTAAINEPRTNSHYWNGSAWVKGYQHESEARTNLVLNSASLATQNVTVTAAPHTLHFVGIGTVTLSGASTAGPLVGTGIGENNRVNLTFIPTAGTLTLTVTGSVTFAQLELGSTPSSYIPTAGATVTRAADVMTLPIANIPYPDVVVIGPELVTNGDLSSGLTGITVGSTATANVVSGELVVTSSAITERVVRWPITCEVGKVYQFKGDIRSTSTSARFRITDSALLTSPPAVTTLLDITPTVTTASYVREFVATATTMYAAILPATDGNSCTVDNISVREINPLAVSIAMDGVVTYADDGSATGSVTYWNWAVDSNNRLLAQVYTDGTKTGDPAWLQASGGILDVVSGDDNYYSPGVNVPFSIASRHGSTFVNGAVDGTALTADLTPVAFPNLSATNMQIGPTFNGFIHKFRMWGDTTGDIGDVGIAEASA